MTAECGEEFSDPGAEVLFGLGEAKRSGELDLSRPGTYTLRYSFLTGRAERTVTVVDTKRPVITLNGLKNITVVKGEEYTEYGYTAVDNADGDITSLVTVESDVDTDKTGVYHVSYVVGDSSGNMTRERRTVSVSEEGPMSMSMKDFDLEPFYSDVIAKEVPFDGKKYADTVVFGDSFVGIFSGYGLDRSDMFWYRDAFAVDEADTKPVKVAREETGLTFFELMDLYRPGHVIVFLGNQTTWCWSIPKFREAYDAFFTKCLEKYPDTVFSVCSLPPYDFETDYEYLESRGFLRNQRVNEVNSLLCELCRKYGMKFINAAPLLKNPENGYCRKEYLISDNFHLTKEGCSIVLEYIKSHMDWQ